MKALVFGFAALLFLGVMGEAQAYYSTCSGSHDGYHRGYYRTGSGYNNYYSYNHNYRPYYHASSYYPYYQHYSRSNTTRYSYNCPRGYRYSARTNSCRRDTYGYGYSRRYETDPIVLLD